ncbi:GNAT family N-acetyltransferase [bacterium]|nr:GNAT family N-acetyltransferase [bacterium]
MFRKMNESDREAALGFLIEDLAYNVFCFGDIENFGFEAPFLDVWGDYSDQDTLRSILLRYYTHYLIAAPGNDFDQAGAVRILQTATSPWYMSGKEEIVKRLAPLAGLTYLRYQYLAELDPLIEEKSQPEYPVEWATRETIHEVFALMNTIVEFNFNKDSTDSFLQNLESGTGRTVFMKMSGGVVSSASSAAENSRSAMIVGVCTAPEFRGKGYASYCMVQLCRTLIDDDKRVFLFYDNPAAGRIYKRIGFRDIGRWAMAFQKE